jgi:hypothetical protein
MAPFPYKKFKFDYSVNFGKIWEKFKLNLDLKKKLFLALTVTPGCHSEHFGKLVYCTHRFARMFNCDQVIPYFFLRQRMI